MKTLIILLLTSFASAAVAAPRFLIRGGAGAHFNEDPGFEVVSGSPARGSGTLGLDVRLWGDLWASADLEGSLTMGETYTRESSYDTTGLALGATWRLTLAPDFVVFARGSAVARRLSFEIGAADGNAWTLGGRAGAGLEWSFLRAGRDFSMGARLEGLYELSTPVDIVASGTRLGEYDPSGPSVLLGILVAL